MEAKQQQQPQPQKKKKYSLFKLTVGNALRNDILFYVSSIFRASSPISFPLSDLSSIKFGFAFRLWLSQIWVVLFAHPNSQQHRYQRRQGAVLFLIWIQSNNNKKKNGNVCKIANAWQRFYCSSAGLSLARTWAYSAGSLIWGTTARAAVSLLLLHSSKSLAPSRSWPWAWGRRSLIKFLFY